MPYGIELSFNNGQEGFEIPVIPPRIEISDSGKSATYDVVQLGEINVIKDPSLSEYAFSSFFPVHRSPLVTTDQLLPPAEYVQYILKWHTTKRPIRFIFVGDTFSINTAASIKTFEWQEIAGSGDIEYSLSLKHYRFFSAKKVDYVQINSQVKTATTAPARANDKQTPRTYTMVAGDTLWSVAKKVFDNPTRWPEIQRLNGITDAEIKRLPVGKVLKLPAG